MDDALRERVEALERAVTDGEHDLSAVADEADALDRLDRLESQVTALEDQVEDLQAATQALRGYVGNVRSVNTEVEQRADAALAKAESLEQRLSGGADSQRSRADDGQVSPDRSVKSTPDGSSTDSGTAVTQSDPHRHTSATQGNRNVTGETRADSHDGFAVQRGHDSGTDQANSHPTDGGVRTAATDHCASCGRPHDSSGSASTARDGAVSDPGERPDRDDQWPTRSGVADDRAQSAESTPTTAGQHTSESADTPSTEPVGGVEGVPTVESLAREPRETDETRDETLPSGDADPLVGAADESGEAGTLQRIRDLL
jgi:hypothetical protein